MFLKDRMILDPSTINIGQGSTARDVIDVLEGAPVVEVTGSDEDDTYDECVIGSVRNIQYKEKKFYGDIWIHPDYFCVNGYSIETKNHDFFSSKGNGYIKTTKVDELTDEAFFFGE